MKKVAIMQSNYIPWKGYFDLINMVDEFILFDDVQYTKKNWRNRNYIKSPNGLVCLTIPIQTKGKFNQPINRTIVENNFWRNKHWKSIVFSYHMATYFSSYRNIFEKLYLNDNEVSLSKINYNLILAVNEILGITTKISWSSDYDYHHTLGENESIIDLIHKTDAQIFINGPASKNYMSEEMFLNYGIKLVWMDYLNYPEYNQLYSPFIHEVSILDLIFNQGPNSNKYLKSFVKF